jgi:hypothetical protein
MSAISLDHCKGRRKTAVGFRATIGDSLRRKSRRFTGAGGERQ